MAVGGPAIVEDLQQDVEHIRVGLFHFIKEDNGVGLAPDCLGELPAFFIAHIAWRGTNQAADGKFLHVFCHIDADQHLFIVKQAFCQGFGQLRLADTGGTEENKGTGWAFRIFQSQTSAADSLGHCRNCLILTQNAFFELSFQIAQTICVIFGQLPHRNIGPAGDNIRYVFSSQDRPVRRIILYFSTFQLGNFALDLLTFSLQFGCLLKIFIFNGCFGLTFSLQ